jgi:predicted transcriptional regulator
MDIQATKIDFIHWLTELQDPAILQQLNVIKGGQDWWDEISEEERLAIDEGIAELDRGEAIPHEEGMKRVRDKFNV